MSKIKILNVEDYDAQRRAISEILNLAGYEVIEAASGREALRLAVAKRPHLVLLDLTLPDISGFEVCQQIKSDTTTASMLVLEISGEFTEGNDKARGLEGGADGYLTKPVGAAELLASINALLRLWRAERKMREAREEAEASEARYRHLVDGLKAIIWEADAGTWQYTFVSRRGEKMLGHPLEQWYAEPDFWRKIVHPDDRERAIENRRVAIAECHDLDTEYRVIAADGRSVWVRDLVYVMKDRGWRVERLQGVMIDITRRKMDELGRRESEARYRLLFEGNSLPTWVFDLETLRFLAVNEAAVLHYGYSREEFLSMTIKDIRPPEDVPALLDHLAGVPRSTNNPSLWRHRKRDGNLIDVEVIGHELIYDGRRARLVLAKDVTEQRRVEHLLRISEERLRIAQQAANSGVWDWDLVTDEVSWSEEYYRLFGLDPSVTPSYENWLSSICEEDRERAERSAGEAAERGGEFNLDFRVIHPETGLRWLHLAGQVFCDDRGRPVRTSGITLDITERKRAEAEREQMLRREQELRRQVEEASRLKDEFLATLSHELRMPLHVVLGNLHLLRSGLMTEEEKEQTLDTIERSARSQNQIVSDLLDVAEMITGKFRLKVRHLDFASVIEAALESLRPAAEAKGIRLRIADCGLRIANRGLRIANRGSRIEDRGSRIEDDHPQSAIRNPQSAILVLGDPDRLQQMVWNLLSNAVKFTPPGGSVHVQLQRRESYAELMVSDTGQGIKPEFLPLVFDRFLQADGSSTRRYGGLGLGLAIVRHLVELHGGSVTAKSDGEGKGSTFIVSLPLADKITELDGLNHLSKLPDSTAPVEFARPVISSIAMPVAEQVFINDLSQGNLPRLDGVNVLVVDDETETCDLLNYILTQCGADVRVAGGTEDALSALKGWRVDLLVSDLGMPNREAENLINSLQQRIGPGWHQPPAVALTARSRAEDRIRALSAGYRINVTKPIEPAELVVAAASLVGRLSNSGTA